MDPKEDLIYRRRLKSVPKHSHLVFFAGSLRGCDLCEQLLVLVPRPRPPGSDPTAAHSPV